MSKLALSGALAFVCLLSQGCASSGAGGGDDGTGGVSGTGGVPGTGGAASGTGGAIGSGGRAGTGGRGSGGSGSGGARMDGGGADLGVTCTGAGNITYTLTRAATPTADESAAYTRITAAMDEAVAYYNCLTSITKSLSVTYVPSVQTADGNVNGSIRFGSTDSMNYITAMHEISHTVGIGSAQFDALVVGGVFTGTTATAQLREITGNAQDVVHGDTQHFWPYGLNYTSEFMSVADLVDHCKMVVAIRKDIGF
jgi:hypothetical protein